MRYFTYKSLDDLSRDCEALGTRHVRFEPDPQRIRAALLRSVPIGSFHLGNSVAIHPMEGCDGAQDGSPGELTWRRYERFARGGAKLLWFEATAVREEGRANPRQLWIHEHNVGAFARLLEMLRRVHREQYGSSADLLEPIQLTHSGRYCYCHPIVAYHNPIVDRKTRIPGDYPVISDDELERLEDDYVAAGRLAQRAGFRAVDLKVTHGYLLSELMGAKERSGRYGGSLENRVRFVTNVLGKFRSEFGRNLILCARLGCYDGLPYAASAGEKTGSFLPYDRPYRHGFGTSQDNPLQEDLTEARQAIALFRGAGLDLLNVSLVY